MRKSFAAHLAVTVGVMRRMAEAVVEAIASTHGDVVVPNGAAEANALGLTTQGRPGRSF